MQTGVITSRTKSKDIPQEYLTKVLEENPTAWGICAINADGSLTISCGDEADVDLIESTVKDFPDLDLVFYFCNSESAINMDDVSPFTLVEEGEGDDAIPKIAAFVEGNFPGFVKKDSSHPSAFHFVEDHLRSKITDLYELAEGDLPKIMNFINKEKFKTELLGHAKDNGVITFVMEGGLSTTLALTGTAAQFPWGWTSNHYGFGEVAEVGKIVPPVKKSMIPNKSTVREKAPVSSVPDVKLPPSDTAIAAATATKYGKKEWRPPENWSRKDRRREFQAKIGFLPKGWENKGFTVEVYYDKQTNTPLNISEVKKLGLALVGLPPLNNKQEHEKNTEADHIPQPEVKEGDSNPLPKTGEVLPIIAPKTREYLKDILRREDVKKLIAENAAVISDPAAVQALEKKIVGFGEQLGLKDGLKDFMKLDYPWFDKIAKEKPDGMANFAWSMRNMLCFFMAEKATKVSATEKHALAHEELTPKRSSMLNKKAG